jgi:hypothetical protein
LSLVTMLANSLSPSSLPSSEPFSCNENGTSSTNKRKRRPAGTPGSSSSP